MPSRRDFHKLSVAAAAAALAANTRAQNAPQVAAPTVQARARAEDRYPLRPELHGTHGIVAAGRHYTVEAGIRILAAGGNAFDAGVAAVFAAAVNEVSHFGMGGEAPAIVFQASTGKISVICGQGTAPKAAKPAQFLAAGVIPGNGPNAGTVPAVIDAMALTLQNFGTMSLAQVLEPAIGLADGFPMYAALRGFLVRNQESTVKWEWSRRHYYPDGRIPETGEIFRQPMLATTLRAIVAGERAALGKGADRVKAIEAGRDVFYKGDVARRIAAAVQADGGLLSYDDLATYRGRLEAAVSTRFQGYDIHKSGFWSQGPTLLLTLNILEAAGIARMPFGGEQYLHTLAEAIKLAFDDRNAWFGDPLFADIPAEGLLSKNYAAERAALIGPQASLQHRYGNPYLHQRGGKPPAAAFRPHQLKRPGDPVSDTTAIEIVDARGNLFSCTPSSGWLIGGAYVAGDTGIPLSNRLTVFDLDPASPNVLVGGKRPRTTLTPTIVTRDGKPFLAIGTPGGDSQDQQIAQVLLSIILGKQSIQQAIESPRLDSIHMHQSFGDKQDAPGVFEIEERVPVEILNALARRGHRILLAGDYGIGSAMVAVGVDGKFGTLRGGADVRGDRYAFGW
ncbi:MAG: gamma-glutamyltransferase family protein [Steroidobacteraceae bacterium]